MSRLVVPGAIPLADFGVDRAAHFRRDPAWLKSAIESDGARIMMMKLGQPLIEGGDFRPPPRVGDPLTGPPAALLWLGPQATMLSPRAQQLFLGLNDRNEPMFALEVPESFSLAASPIAGLGEFQDFRASASMMNAFDSGLAATARALFEWRRRHGYCSNCGEKTAIADAGWKSVCPDCKAEHFPRVDPVAIMLGYRGDMCLMGRQAAWAPGFWSCLAGFVEPGETFEQAGERELFEEAGIRSTGKVEYLFGQPWPFPSSLMIGLLVEAAEGDISVDAHELEDARWFTRNEARAMLARNHPDSFAPPPFAIAHHVLKAWVERG